MQSSFRLWENGPRLRGPRPLPRGEVGHAPAEPDASPETRREQERASSRSGQGRRHVEDAGESLRLWG